MCTSQTRVWRSHRNFEIKAQTIAGVFTAGSNNTISRNVIHHVGSPSIGESEGVRVNRGSGNRVAGNTIHHIGPGAESRGIWLLESRDGIVEDNTAYLIRKDGIRDWKGLDNTLRRNNSFLNWVGISLNTTTGATVVDNMIYENTQGLQLKHLSYSRVLDYWGLPLGRWSVVTHNTVFRSTEASASVIDPDPAFATGHPKACPASINAQPTAELIGRLSGLKECAATPPKSAVACGVFQARARTVAGAAAGIPNRASRNGCRGTWMIGASMSSSKAPK